VASGGDGSTQAHAQFNDAGVEFVSGMVPHHEQAGEMTDMILAKDPSMPIRALAENMKDFEKPETEELNALLESLGEEAGAGDGGHGGGSGAAGPPG